ncbi:MAG: haloacid dehalogenase, partial [Anaerolineae bacterium]|nr:haloacid dehalogenase [Anaerolineae bacterium]
GAEIARTMLLNFLTLTGIVLIVFAEPPTEFWVGGDDFSGDWRPTILALGMAICLLLSNLLPGVREVFELEVLTLPDYGVIIGATLIWTVLMRSIWRARLFDRFLGLDG